MTNNKTILAWIDEMKALVNPDQVVWIDGSEEQLEEPLCKIERWIFCFLPRFLPIIFMCAYRKQSVKFQN